jgi:cytoskeleton protein RodZ
MSEDTPLKPNQSVGHQLKSRRQALRLSLAQVEVQTKIRGKYLTALEAGDYAALPNDVYSRGFVQHYATHLGLDGLAVAAAYVAERGGLAMGETKRPKLERGRRLVFTGPILAAIAVVAALAALLAYLLWQFSALAAPPGLTLSSPVQDVALTGGVVDVSGRTTPGADVSINDSPVLTDVNGAFNEKVALQDGVNTVRVAARSKLGKTTVVTRNVLAHLPRVDAATATVPAAPFDGIAMVVKVTETTSMVVISDGKEVWRGTVVAGKSLRFDAKERLSVTTGNAGATSLTITNAVAAGKAINPLGRSGEIRRNQEFAKDTVIP